LIAGSRARTAEAFLRIGWTGNPVAGYGGRRGAIASGPKLVNTCERSERIWENQSAGANCAGGWNEGVGEHVRTRFHFGALDPGEIAELKEIRTERRKPVSSAGPILQRASS
jgi:hypothetical protein